MHRRNLIAAGGTAALVVALGGGVAYASAGDAGTPAKQPAQAADQAHQKPANGKKARPLARRAVHGEVTVRTKKGFKTIAVQRGTVTSASATKLTVTSKDKYVHTYTMNKDTRVRLDKKKADAGDVKTGQRVRVVTSPKAGTSVAKRVMLRNP